MSRKHLLSIPLCLFFFAGSPSSAALAEGTGWQRPTPKESLDVLKTADIHDFIDQWTGSQIYPSEFGIPGWPGFEEDHEVRGRKWGFPERIPYPGSVEHVRNDLQRYVPPVPVFNARTLVKSFLAADLPGIPAERLLDHAEPVYYVPKYEAEIFTGQHRKPVKALLWEKTNPPIELPLGDLGPGIYTVRLIACTATKHVERTPKRLVIRFTVNDGPQGETSEYRKRCAAIDEFYSVVEFFFVAPGAREYRASLRLDDSTRLPVLYVHSIDMHDRLAPLARRAGKKSPTYHDAGQRLETWKAKETLKPDARTQEERFADDLKLWQSCMAINAQPTSYGYYENWQALHRSAASMVPEGVKDDGTGIDFYGAEMFWNRPKEFIDARLDSWTTQRTLQIAPKLNLSRHTAYPMAWSIENGSVLTAFDSIGLAAKYHETGDESLARKASVLLARLALQSMTHGCRQTMSPYDLIPQLVHGDTAFRRRMKEMPYEQRGHYGDGPSGFVHSYDFLFPYIQGNQELAESLGRFLPWIQSPGDLTRFYETCLLQHYAFQVMSYNAYLDSPTPAWMANVIAVQQDSEITRPWVDWLFRYVWTYPNLPVGIDETAVNSIGRDGGNRKGSTFYSLEGSDLPSILNALSIFVRQGGRLPIDMTDSVKFPKAEASRTFRNGVNVAGGYSFWIGDVSGPNRAREKNAPKNPSRVLSDWFGVLETGQEHDDFRFRRAAGVRVGHGVGHHHDDPLDLQIWAHGVPICGDGGGRTGYAVPATAALQSHNTVVSPLAMETLHRWVSSIAPDPGAQYLEARVSCSGFYGRQIALIDADDDKAVDPARIWPKTPNSYVVDVFRVKGGSAPDYAFHGPPADEFVTNALNTQKTRHGGFLDSDSHWAGNAPEILSATWRMRRDAETIRYKDGDGKTLEFHVPAAERQAMNESLMGAKITEEATRKFIRMHLLGHAGAKVWGARTFCPQGEPYTNKNVYVTSADWRGETLYPVVFEPYAGQPFIESVHLLCPQPPISSSSAPVAMEVKLAGQRRDVVFMAARGSVSTDVQGLGAVQAEYAFVSWDAGRLRQAVLVGGRRLKTKEIEIETEAEAYEGTVVSVDYYAKRAIFSRPLPRAAEGAVMEIGPAARRTSYTIDKVEGATITFGKGMDLAMSRVTRFMASGAPVLQSPIERWEGLTATDETFKHWWRVGKPIRSESRSSEMSAAAGGSAHPAEMQDWELAVQLDDGPDPKATLKPGDSLWLWEFGPGDAWRLPAQVNVRRKADGSYSVEGNVRAKATMGGKKLVLQP